MGLIYDVLFVQFPTSLFQIDECLKRVLKSAAPSEEEKVELATTGRWSMMEDDEFRYGGNSMHMVSGGCRVNRKFAKLFCTLGTSLG